MMHHMLRNASPEKRRILFAIYGGLLTIGIALVAAQIV